MTLLDVVRFCCHTRDRSGRAYPAEVTARPPTLELSLRTAEPHTMNTSEPRLLPRYRHASLVDQHQRTRAQAAILIDALDRDPDAQLPLRHELTKPGDAEALRGIPAIGRSVAGAIADTDPERETLRRITRLEQLRERTAA